MVTADTIWCLISLSGTRAGPPAARAGAAYSGAYVDWGAVDNRRTAQSLRAEARAPNNPHMLRQGGSASSRRRNWGAWYSAYPSLVDLLRLRAALAAEHIFEVMVLHAAKPELGAHADERKEAELVLLRWRVLSIIAVGAAKQGITASTRDCHFLKVHMRRAKGGLSSRAPKKRGP